MGDRAAVGAVEQALLLHQGEVAANRCGRHAELAGQLADRHRAVLRQPLDDDTEPVRLAHRVSLPAKTSRNLVDI